MHWNMQTRLLYSDLQMIDLRQITIENKLDVHFAILLKHPRNARDKCNRLRRTTPRANKLSRNCYPLVIYKMTFPADRSLKALSENQAQGHLYLPRTTDSLVRNTQSPWAVIEAGVGL